MENTKAKKILIVILLVLLLACLGIIVYQYLKLNKVIGKTTKETTNVIDNQNEKKDESKNIEQIEKTDTTKCEENNKRGYIPVSKTQYDNYSIVVYAICNYNLGTFSFSVDKDGGIEATYQANSNEFSENQNGFESGKTYKVTGLTKKAVGVYCGYSGNGSYDSTVAIMEDGSLEQIIVSENKLVSNGTLKGVSNVVRLEQGSIRYNQGGGSSTIIAVQEDGNCVILSNLKDWSN